MIPRHPARGRVAGARRLIPILVAALGCPAASEAGLTLTGSSASILYLTETKLEGTTSGGPVFASGGGLLSPGGGFPQLSGNAYGPVQSANTNSLASPFVVFSSTTPGSGAVSGNVAPNFGTAGTAISTVPGGQQGTLTPIGGLYWDTRTSLSDNLTSPSDANLASVSFSSASATYTNYTGADVFFNPVALLSVRGTVGAATASYVAASLVSSFSLSGTTGSTSFAPIVLAASKAGQSVDIAGDGYSGGFNTTTGKLFVTGSSTYNTLVDVAANQSITITAQLTLISDPGSTIMIDPDLAGGFTAPSSTFGTFAGGPLSSFATVPEPSTAVLLGLGLASASALAWRHRARG